MLCKMLHKNGHVGKQKHPTLLEHTSYASVGVRISLLVMLLGGIQLLSSILLWSLHESQVCSHLLSSFLFPTPWLLQCYTLSVSFHLILCNSFLLSFYLFHGGRNSFMYFSLFPEPAAKSLEYRRCFSKCLLNWITESSPQIIPSHTDCVCLPGIP